MKRNKIFRQWYKDSFKTFQEAGDKIGVCRATVWHWYHGRTIPSISTIAKLNKMSNGQVSLDTWVAAVGK